MANTGFVLPAAAIGLGSLLLRPRRGFFQQGTDQLLIPVPQATISEHHTDRLVITQHPVEQNAPISDHAYKMPSEVTIRCAWSNSPSAPSGVVGGAVAIGIDAAVGKASINNPAIGNIAAGITTVAAAISALQGADINQAQFIYSLLLQLQDRRVTFDILTGKRPYANMLFEELSVDTDRLTENCLMLTARCQQIITTTSTIQVPVNVSANAAPEKLSPPLNLGAKNLLPGSNFKPLTTFQDVAP